MNENKDYFICVILYLRHKQGAWKVTLYEEIQIYHLFEGFPTW